jgi:hypothetical protein
VTRAANQSKEIQMNKLMMSLVAGAAVALSVPAIAQQKAPEAAKTPAASISRARRSATSKI